MANKSPSDALLKVADGLEKLANSIEGAADAEAQKLAAQASTPSVDPDYGTLGSATGDGYDPLTSFLLK
jgi:hypothetical protein